LTLLSAVAVHTEHIGLVGTLSTSYNEPFNVARRLASLDLISAGRAGWNVVATGDGGTAGNFGREEHYDYPTRYGRALEHVGVVQGLWDSYEDDAFPRDRERGVFFDPARQHALGHKGKYFQVAGPLNVERSRQGHPVIFQAGDSHEGRDLGAAVGEVIFTHAATLEQGRAFALDIRSRPAAKGRDPEELLIFSGIYPTIADTDEEARNCNVRPAQPSSARSRSSAARSAGTTSPSTIPTPRSPSWVTWTTAASAPRPTESNGWLGRSG
jgi:FMN-dependent oxidoreductase (nitrilotriacetate monooxygenase family)